MSKTAPKIVHKRRHHMPILLSMSWRVWITGEINKDTSICVASFEANVRSVKQRSCEGDWDSLYEAVFKYLISVILRSKSSHAVSA